MNIMTTLKHFLKVYSVIPNTKHVLSMACRLMSKALKPNNPENKNGYIYVLKASPAKDSVYKIGRTANLHKRLQTYSTGTIDGVELVFKYRTDSSEATENCLKAVFKQDRYRKRKELYKADINDIKAITKKCDELVNFKRVYARKETPAISGGYYVIVHKDKE